jgi:hypothetical protein
METGAWVDLPLPEDEEIIPPFYKPLPPEN